MFKKTSVSPSQITELENRLNKWKLAFREDRSTLSDLSEIIQSFNRIGINVDQKFFAKDFMDKLHCIRFAQHLSMASHPIEAIDELTLAALNATDSGLPIKERISLGSTYLVFAINLSNQNNLSNTYSCLNQLISLRVQFSETQSEIDEILSKNLVDGSNICGNLLHVVNDMLHEKGNEDKKISKAFELILAHQSEFESTSDALMNLSYSLKSKPICGLFKELIDLFIFCNKCLSATDPRTADDYGSNYIWPSYAAMELNYLCGKSDSEIELAKRSEKLLSSYLRSEPFHEFYFVALAKKPQLRTKTEYSLIVREYLSKNSRNYSPNKNLSSNPIIDSVYCVFESSLRLKIAGYSSVLRSNLLADIRDCLIFALKHAQEEFEKQDQIETAKTIRRFALATEKAFNIKISQSITSQITTVTYTDRDLLEKHLSDPKTKDLFVSDPQFARIKNKTVYKIKIKYSTGQIVTDSSQLPEPKDV